MELADREARYAVAAGGFAQPGLAAGFETRGWGRGVRLGLMITAFVAREARSAEMHCLVPRRLTAPDIANLRDTLGCSGIHMGSEGCKPVMTKIPIILNEKTRGLLPHGWHLLVDL